ncbi:hypothetical protein GCM10027449_07610 [Sinomonas notoginsengisoli]|uniref:hypothetical protein n=1 Tax=Sinomonas notoginsengisoli TaxID=1457311 RepID=UPI001F406374|nr:hypothetical protein [Sinomonas notoginsengisoli]
MDAAAARVSAQRMAIAPRVGTARLRALFTGPLSHWWGDAAMAALAVAFGIIEGLGHVTAWTPVQRVLILGALAIGVLARSRYPYAAAVIMGAVFGAGPALGYAMDNSTATLVGGLAVIWALGARLPLAHAVWGTVILLVTVSVGFADPVGSFLWNAGRHVSRAAHLPSAGLEEACPGRARRDGAGPRGLSRRRGARPGGARADADLAGAA